MRFTSDQAECSEARGSFEGGCGAAVCVSGMDVAGLSEEQLRARIGVIGKAESKLAAMKSQTVAEIARQHNAVTAERVVREELQSSKRAARHDVKAAERLAALEATSEALAAGDIPQGCIGCGTAPNRCFSHHVKFWRNGGPTDYPNLVLVCNDCHHDIHDHGFQAIQDPDNGQWKTQPPPDPFPDTGSTTWQPTHTSTVLLN